MESPIKDILLNECHMISLADLCLMYQMINLMGNLKDVVIYFGNGKYSMPC